MGTFYQTLVVVLRHVGWNGCTSQYLDQIIESVGQGSVSRDGATTLTNAHHAATP